MLRIDVRTLRRGSAPIEAKVAPDDAAFEGLGLNLQGPVLVTGQVQGAGAGTYRLEGRAQGLARGECRRCLAEVQLPFDVQFDAVFTTSHDMLDDPGVYQLTEPVTHIDLTEAVREEVGLAVPTYTLCREDCAGLCPNCGADLNEGPCACVLAPKTT
jgi:DUF177 domain-containing protein